MALDWSFEPNPDLKGSYYRRLDDIPRALAKFEVTALPANCPAQFVAYYFGVEKLAKALVGINTSKPAKDAFHRRVSVKLPETKSAAHDMGLKISEPELDDLFEPQWDREQPSSAITIRNRLGHDFGPTQVWHIHQHAPRLVPIMVRFIDDIDRVLQHLRVLWATLNARP
ncbi:hypothetical protein [Bradyrhizobium diazoefficiens]|uniref:hypothetical protein n=1 Tax=Bradyrhizobium diazoefficiens TaxID=1355477 RepID=UPI00272D78C8|nr:hypothetical protein [Bradyrhizobium diazoefficiens]WLA68549.1 hypothetical protein QNN01_18940 [Bradyrhizobium diazoefficiens]